MAKRRSGKSGIAPENVKSMFSTMMDFTPVVGEIKSAKEGVESYNKGDYLGATLGAVGAIPLIGGVAKASKKVSDFFEKGVDYAPKSKSRELVVDMPIDEFLSLAKPGYDTTKAKRVSSMIKEGKKFDDIPHLTTRVKGDKLQVVGHEGRHRARALKELGYKTIPVKIQDSTIRWDQQANPKLFDYIENWPSKIVSEDGEKAVNMFIGRDLTTLPIEPVNYVSESKKKLAEIAKTFPESL